MSLSAAWLLPAAPCISIKACSLATAQNPRASQCLQLYVALPSPSTLLQVDELYNPVPTIKSLLPVFKISHILELGVTHPLVQVDELYNHRTRLVCSAAAPPDQLFAGADHSEPIIDLEQLQVGSCCSCLVLLFI